MTDIFYIAPAPKVTIPLASTVTGLTEKAIRCNIDKGVWVEGKQYNRAPDGRIWIILKGVEKWVEREAA